MLPPKDSHACCTPWSVFQDGSDAAIRTPTTSARGVTQLPAGKRINESLKGGLSHFPPKFKNIFVVIITFSPFLLCK